MSLYALSLADCHCCRRDFFKTCTSSSPAPVRLAAEAAWAHHSGMPACKRCFSLHTRLRFAASQDWSRLLTEAGAGGPSSAVRTAPCRHRLRHTHQAVLLVGKHVVQHKIAAAKADRCKFSISADSWKSRGAAGAMDCSLRSKRGNDLLLAASIQMILLQRWPKFAILH